MDRSYQQRNARDRDRLRHVAVTADEAMLLRRIGVHWTVAAALAHLAFWDRWVVARWDQYDREGAIQDLPDCILNLANAAGLPEWLALPPRTAATLALEAADVVDRRIAALTTEAVAHALATGRPADRPWLIARSTEGHTSTRSHEFSRSNDGGPRLASG